MQGFRGSTTTTTAAVTTTICFHRQVGKRLGHAKDEVI